jgi:hypothetical protein
MPSLSSFGRRRRDDADKAAKEAARAAKEQAKTEYLSAWIAERGSESQKARSKENLLPRDEAISALAEATFTALATKRSETNRQAEQLTFRKSTWNESS